MSKNKRLNSWEVAAAVLLVEGRLHIDELTDLVVASGISTLGLRGSTPRQSLGPQLTKRGDIFRWDRGFYWLRSDAPQRTGHRVEEAKLRYVQLKGRRAQSDAENRAKLERLHAILKSRVENKTGPI